MAEKQESSDVENYFGTILWQMTCPEWTDDLTLKGFEPNMREWSVSRVDADQYVISTKRGEIFTGTKERVQAQLEVALLHYVEDVKVLGRNYTEVWEDQGVEIKQPYLMIQAHDSEIRIKPSIILDDPKTQYRHKVLVFVDDRNPDKVLYQYAKGTDLIITASYDEALNFLKGA